MHRHPLLQQHNAAPQIPPVFLIQVDTADPIPRRAPSGANCEGSKQPEFGSSILRSLFPFLTLGGLMSPSINLLDFIGRPRPDDGDGPEAEPYDPEIDGPDDAPELPQVSPIRELRTQFLRDHPSEVLDAVEHDYATVILCAHSIAEYPLGEASTEPWSPPLGDPVAVLLPVGEYERLIGKKIGTVNAA